MGMLNTIDRIRGSVLAVVAVVAFLGMALPISAACDDHEEEAASHEACPAATCCCASHAPALTDAGTSLVHALRTVSFLDALASACTGIVSADAPFQPPRA